MIPLGLISFIISEREDRSLEVVKEISQTWGKEQAVIGPVLKIPYEYDYSYYSNSLRKYEYTKMRDHFYILPETLNVDADLKSQIRKRGIFEAFLYAATMKVSGEFKIPDTSSLNLNANQIFWSEATVLMNLSDMKALQEGLVMRFEGEAIKFEPSTLKDVKFINASGLEASIKHFATNLQTQGLSIPFSFDLKFRGSQKVKFFPMAKQTHVKMKSDWPHPSFQGNYLPDQHKISEKGYEADWKVLYLGRDYPQQWKADEVRAHHLNQSSFGVDLVKPVDVYQQTTRSVKYAILFVVFTFCVFFLFEILVGLRIHPLQYTLVGVGLSLFYLLLLSLSEHIAFGVAYAIATLAIVGLITSYSLSVLKAKARALGMGVFLFVIYGFLYVLLQTEDMALLLGSIGLLILLAAAMYATCRVDWYNLNVKKE